jgi:hypothetical protein
LKSTIGLQRLYVGDNNQQINNGVESFRASFRRLVKVSHPSLYISLEYLKEVCRVKHCWRKERLNRGVQIRQPTHKANLVNDKRQCKVRGQASAQGLNHGASVVCKSLLRNVIDPLHADNDGISTDEYEVDAADHAVDGTPAAAAAVAATAVAASRVFCDVCLVAPREQNCGKTSVTVKP